MMLNFPPLWNVSLGFLFLSRHIFNLEILPRSVFLSWSVCIVKYQVARLWIRLFRQKGSGTIDIGQFPLTSVFFFYLLKLLLAKILSFLTLCHSTIRSPSPLEGIPQLSWNVLSVCFPHVLPDPNGTKHLETLGLAVRHLTLQSSIWAEKQREEEIGSTSVHS